MEVVTMPYGYERYLESKNKSEKTIDTYTKTIYKFFGYLNEKYKKDKELYEISTRDIVEFFSLKVQSGELKESTANKQIAILKSFFDYLWRTDQIPYDPAVKIPKFCDPHNAYKFMKYEKICEIKKKVIENENYSPLRKAVFVLASYGCFHQEFLMKKEDVVHNVDGTITINLVKRTINLSGKEAIVFNEHYKTSLHYDSPFVFTSRKQNGEIIGIEVMTLLNHLRKISTDYELPIRLTFISLKWSYSYYLFFNENLSIPEHAKMLGNEETTSASTYSKYKKAKEVLGEDIFRNGVYIP
jgi:site-specific recombinase XerD